MKRFYNIRGLAFLILTSLIASCASEVSLVHPAQIAKEIIAPPITKSLDKPEVLKVFKPEPIFVEQKGPVGTIKSDEKVLIVRGLETKNLTFDIDYSSLLPSSSKNNNFKTQALRCSDFSRLKVSINGIGMATPLYPAGVDGNNTFGALGGCTISATVPNVPFGTARIATVEAYQADGTTLIAGTTVKTVFNITADPTNVQIGFHTTPNGTVVESIIASNNFTAAYMNLGDLKTLVDNITGVSGTFPDLSYTFHPSNVDTAQLASDLIGNSGNSGALTAGDYDNIAFSSVTGTLAGLLGSDTASIQVTDPASPISINNGNGGFTFSSNVKNGTWVVHAEAPGYTADVTPATTIAAGATDPVGTITFTWANTPNITGLSSSAEPIGTSININGTDFHPEIAGNAVTFNGVAATVTAASPTQLTVTVPATATDGNVVVTVGTVASNGVNFDVMPTISITAPTNASVVNGASSAITTSFTSGNTVTNVEFFLDGTGGTSLGTDNTSPYTLNWDTTGQTSGAHTLVARITDSATNQAVSTAINITIDQPPNVGTPTSNTATAPGLGYPIQVQTASTDDITTLVDATYTWSCTANCGDSSFSQTDSPQVIWTAPSTDQGAAATIQVSVDDGVNTPVTDTINLNYLTGTADVNIIGISSLDDVSTWAGGGSFGYVEGDLLNARFNLSRGLAIDATGNLYVADTGNHVIRKISTNGIVSTLAGSGVAGYNDATGALAQFDDPQSVAVDSSGNVFVADRDNEMIRKITPAGVVTTLAGSGVAGYNDATGALAQFDEPMGIAIDSSDNIYVADKNNHRIRKVTPAGVVTTFAGSGTAGITNGVGGFPLTADFKFPHGVDVDGSDDIYVADYGNGAIRKITSAGVVTLMAGNGTLGFVNGTGAAAQLNNPHDLVVDGSGNVFVADRYNHAIRKVTPAGVTTTVAGAGTSGFVDGQRDFAKFNHPIGIVMDGSGTLLVVDKNNRRIRRVRP